MEDNLPQGLLWNDALPSITLIRWNWRGLLILAQRTRLSYFMGRLTAGPKSEIGQKSGFTWIYCSIKSWVGWSDSFNSPPNHLHPPEKRTRMPLLKIAGKTAPFVESFTFQDTWIHGGSTNFLNRFWTFFLSHAGFEPSYLTSSNDPLPGNCLMWPLRGSPTIEDQVREELFITWWGIFVIFEAFWSPRKVSFPRVVGPNPLHLCTVVSFQPSPLSSHQVTSLPDLPEVGLCLMDFPPREEGGRESPNKNQTAKLLDENYHNHGSGKEAT